MKWRELVFYSVMAWGRARFDGMQAFSPKLSFKVIFSTALLVMAGLSVAVSSSDALKPVVFKSRIWSVPLKIDKTPRFVVWDFHQGHPSIIFTTSSRVYRLHLNGHITPIAGNGKGGAFFNPSNNGKPATDIPLGSVDGVGVTPNGDIIFADGLQRIVYKVDRAGKIHAIAGNGHQHRRYR